jgi:hypothetical protein
MKIKTSELTGPTLNWGVAKAQDLHVFSDGRSWIVEYKGGGGRYAPLPKFSTDWAQGGPIIERESIGILPSGNAYYERNGGTYYSYGPTPLIAAMRCYVLNKLGDEVEVPDELI